MCAFDARVTEKIEKKKGIQIKKEVAPRVALLFQIEIFLVVRFFFFSFAFYLSHSVGWRLGRNGHICIEYKLVINYRVLSDVILL